MVLRRCVLIMPRFKNLIPQLQDRRVITIWFFITSGHANFEYAGAGREHAI